MRCSSFKSCTCFRLKDNFLVGEIIFLELDEPRYELVAGGHLALGLEHSVVADLLEHAVTTRVNDAKIVVVNYIQR